MKQLTALQWFEYLPDEIRDKAQAYCMTHELDNGTPNRWDLKFDSLENKAPTMQGRYADVEQFKASKSRKPLFTTEDGVEIFEGDVWHLIDPDYWRIWSGNHSTVNPDRIKYFSTRQAAEEYILMNKPCLSLKEVIDLVEAKEYLTQLVKSKLNKHE
jgi:hypothetical protein